MKNYVINLSDGFEPESAFTHNPLDFALSTFPGGEPHFFFKEIPHDAKVSKLTITQRYMTVADLMLIVLVNDAARRIGFNDIELVLPYFPGARQDRVCNPGEALTVKVFANIINSCKFSKVSIYSPHSEVTPAVIDNCEVIDLDPQFLSNIITLNRYDTIPYFTVNIVCPDAGAGKRVSKLAKHLAKKFSNLTVNLIRCEKVRDVVTGELKEFFVQADDLGHFPTIICDDIVAYGGTFKGLGEVLRKKNAGDLILFTSHADCVEGVDAMTAYFDQFYTSNSKKDWVTIGRNKENFHCFQIKL